MLLLLMALVAMALPAASGALTVEIENQSGLPDDQVYVNVNGAAGQFDVPGFANDVPVKFSSIAGGQITVNQLVSGRIYISYNDGVPSSVPFSSPTRFDWAELTVIPSTSDVANLTAVDQFGIGMRLETYDGGGAKLEEIGTANSNTVFAALAEIPGGKAATIRNGAGKPLRVLSPIHTSYPGLGKYVKSMSGKKVTLNTAFFGQPFTASSYSGKFAADGSITLTGTTNPAGIAPAKLSFSGADLIRDIETGGNTPNNLSGAIYRDLLAGFSTGMWGGKYGYDARNFCSNAVTTAQGTWCPNGFNKPAFGDARSKLESYPTCEQYAAVINQFSDSYGNPYSDAAKKTTVSLNQPATGGTVSKLKLTILPDEGTAKPVKSGNPNCGAAGSSGAPARFKVRFRGSKKARVRNNRARIGTIVCSAACGRVSSRVRLGKKVLGQSTSKSKSRKVPVKVDLRKGRKILKKRERVKAQVRVVVIHGKRKYVRKGKVLLKR